MEDEPPASSEGQQNLNDLQSYLVHFNKEIGNNDSSNFQQKFISQMISVTPSEKSTPSEEELPVISGNLPLPKKLSNSIFCVYCRF